MSMIKRRKMTMENNIKNIITESIKIIIEKSSSKNKLEKLDEIHSNKIHFIPKEYRILGGILQSMNIQFGNFIETLMYLLIKDENKYEILENYSSKKNNSFQISTSNEALIDKYITDCQTEIDRNTEDIEKEFISLMKKIILNKDTNLESFKHDIDLLFKDKTNNKIYYLEIKYNDDHDTGKFIDINRKFIKTYAYLSQEFNIKNYDEIIPILFFFTNKKMKGNIYIPEKNNIMRGKYFFNKFLNVKYSIIEKYINELSENEENIKMFHNLYKSIIIKQTK